LKRKRYKKTCKIEPEHLPGETPEEEEL
jgi:hypothetical protein